MSGEWNDPVHRSDVPIYLILICSWSSSVPISKIASMIRETTEDFKNRGIVACHFGHVGDGNVHSLALFKNDEELQVVKNGVVSVGLPEPDV